MKGKEEMASLGLGFVNGDLSIKRYFSYLIAVRPYRIHPFIS